VRVSTQANNGRKFDETGLFYKQKVKLYGILRAITYKRMSVTVYDINIGLIKVVYEKVGLAVDWKCLYSA